MSLYMVVAEEGGAMAVSGVYSTYEAATGALVAHARSTGGTDEYLSSSGVDPATATHEEILEAWYGEKEAVDDARVVFGLAYDYTTTITTVEFDTDLR